MIRSVVGEFPREPILYLSFTNIGLEEWFARFLSEQNKKEWFILKVFITQQKKL